MAKCAKRRRFTLLRQLRRRQAARSAMGVESLERRAMLATYYWDPNGSAAGLGGSGTWDHTSAFWTTDPQGLTGHVAWNDTANDTAVFAGTAGTVSINTAAPGVSAGSVRFETAGYTIASVGGDWLRMAGDATLISASSTLNVRTSINAPLTGTSGLRFSNSVPGTPDNTGIIQLGGDNSGLSGGLTIDDGIRVQTGVGPNALGAGEITVNDGGQLFIFGGGSYAKTVHITGLGWRESSAGGNAYGALRLDSGVTWSGLVDLVGDAGVGSGYGSGTVSGKITGAGKLTLNPASNRELFLAGTTNDYTGGTVVSGGRITLRTNAKLGTGEVTVASGAQIYVSAANTLTNAFSIAGDGGNGPDTQPRGALRLEGGSTITGMITLTANASIGSYVSSTGFVSGNIVGPFDLTINKATSTTAGTITLTGANSYAATTIGSGAVRIGKGGRSGTIGTGSIVNNGQLAFHRTDTTTLTSSITGAGTVSVARGGALTVGSGASITTNQIEVGDNSAAGLGAGTLTILPGSLITAANLYLGNRDGQAGTVNQSGGTVSITGASGTVGDTSPGGVRIGHWANATSNYNLSGGSLAVAGDLSVGWDGTGRFTQTGGTVSANRLVVNDGTSLNGLGSGTFILNAGTCSLGSGGIVTAGGSTSIQLGGGTLAAAADWSATLPIALTGSTVIDTSGRTITLNGAVSGTGSLTKSGAGTLALDAVNTFTGTATVTAGLLQVNGSIVGPVSQSGGTVAGATGWYRVTISDLIRGETASESTGTLTPSALIVSAQDWLQDWRAAIRSRVTGSVTTPDTHSGTFPGSRYFRVDSAANLKTVSGNSLRVADSLKLIVWEDWTDFDWDDDYFIVTATSISTPPIEPDCGCQTCRAEGVVAVPGTGDTSASTGMVAYGSGGGITPSVGFELNQAAAFSSGLGVQASTGEFGTGWSQTGIARVVAQGSDPANPDFVSVVLNGLNARVFLSSPGSGGPTFARANGLGTTDTLSLEGGRYVFRTAAGDTYTFNTFGSGIPALARGALVSQTDASGNRLEFTFNPDGSAAVLTSFLAGQSTPVEVHEYAYLSSGSNAGKVSHIDIKQGDGTLVRSVSLGYYDGTTSFGSLGQLASITTRDAAGGILDAKAYRYANGPSGDSLLQYMFDSEAVRRVAAAGLNIATAANTLVAPFATSYLEYDAQNRVTRHDVQGAGCSTCTGGIGSFSYAYAQNPASGLSDSAWQTKTTETRPDGTERIVYSNGRLQTMLEVIRTNDGGTPKQFGTYTRYDSRGLAIWKASPEAVLLPSDLSVIEQYADLMHNVGGNFEYISDSSGLINVTSYYVGTTATGTAAGSADRSVSSTAVQRGELGTPVLQASYTYFVQAGGGSTVTLTATRTTYPNATTSGAQTTTYGYTYAPGTTQVVSQSTALPVVSAAQNGLGEADVASRVFDSSGREIWSKDADGFLRYTQYDAQSGAVVKTIVDVDTSRTSDFQNLPSGWATPSGGGLHIVTTYEVDRLGRTVKSTDPNGNVTYTVYDDVNHSTRTYVDWNASTGTTTGPIQVSRSDLTGTYTESLSYSAVPTVDAGGRPTGTEAISNLQSLTRSLLNAAGQVIAVDRYTDLAGLAYSTAVTLGVAGTNYLRTLYAYNNQGQVDRVQNPAGTITHSIYDGLSRLVSTWIGTDDSTTDGYKWTPANGSGSSNMTQVTANEYDNGGVGNGNLTKSTLLPGGGASPRVTQNFYDWRNRLVATKAGASATPSTEDASVNRPLSFTDYDNLGRVIGQGVYDGDGVVIVDANSDGVPDKPAAGLLRSLTTTTYDAQDRTFKTQAFAVDQSTGAVGASLTTSLFYDHRGNVVMTIAPNGQATQSRYDGAGRLTGSYTLGNVPSATWANATSLAASLILEQSEYGYDAAGNVILTVNRQRFHDASTTAFGGLGTPASGIPARVSYAASYFDAANRLTASVNVGTNGGLAYTRSATVPARSDTALVTSYAYDIAGRVQDVTDPNGITARTLYDALSRTTASIANYTGGAAGTQTDVTTLFTFDSAGRLASRTAVQPTGTPSQVTGYVYGVSPATGSTITSNDIMAETRYPDPVTGLPSASERDVYTTNALGERTSFTDRAGTTHAYAYDVIGRQTTDAVTALGAGVDGAVRRIESGYDTLGHVTTVTSFNAVTGGTATNQVARAYNGFGQLATEWQSHTGLVNPATTPRVQYAYSVGTSGNHSRLTGVTYPDGYAVAYTYSGIDDAVSRLTSLTGLPATGSTTPVTLEAFKYLGAGTVIERSRPEVNVALSMVSTTSSTGDAGDQYTGLDRFGRVVDQRWLTGSGATATDLDRYGYTYDRNSNRLTRSNALASAFSETYSYDPLNQLQGFVRGSTSSPSTSQNWQFDALGNWTTVTTDSVDQTRTANAQNELTQVAGASLAYSTTGNLTTDAQGRTLAYDAWNRLVSVSNPAGTQVARYEYDGLNHRIVEQVGTAAVPAAASAAIRDVFYSQEWQVLEERVRDAGGSIPAVADTRYVWSPVYVDAMVARDRNADANTATGTNGLEERVYALQDANWNTTGLVTASGVPGTAAGTVINRFAYTPYGESQTLSASWGTPAAGSAPITPWSHLFQGLKLTDVTGLAYVRHRDYSPTLGRFIERDPIGFEAGDNNWYRFVANSPIAQIDPLGLWVWPWAPTASWNPLDTAGLWIGGLNDLTLKPIARGMWGWVINEQLQPMGYDAAAYLLGWSLQNNPSDIHLGPSHFISKKIAASSEYQAAKEKIINDLKLCMESKGSSPLTFEEGDLFAALHQATLEYTASKSSSGTVAFHATIKDRYDFSLQVKGYYGAYGRKWLAVMANNMAWSDQFFGVVRNYDVDVEIE